MNASLFIEPLSAGRVGAYCIRPTKRHQRWRKMSCFSPLRGRLWGVFDTPLRIGYVQSFEIPMLFPNRIRMALQKTIPFSSPSGPLMRRIQYAPTAGYVQSFKIPMLFPNRVHTALRKTVPFLSPTGPLVGRIQYAPTTGYVRSLEIRMRFYNRVRVWPQKIRLAKQSRMGDGGLNMSICSIMGGR